MGQLDSGPTECLRVTSTIGTLAGLERIITSTKVNTSNGEIVAPEVLPIEVVAVELLIAGVVMATVCIVT